MMTAAARAAPHATAGGSCFLSSTNGEPIRRHRSRRHSFGTRLPRKTTSLRPLFFGRSQPAP
jgi:hypothetical protein